MSVHQNLGQTALIACALLSAVVAWATFAHVLYRDYLRPGKISIGINQLTVLRPPSNNRELVMRRVIEEDFLSPTKSDWANALISKDPSLPALLKSGQQALFHSRIQSILKKDQLQVYCRPELVIQVAKQTDFATSFAVPVNIINTGAKALYVSQLVLVFEGKTSASTFYFDAFICLRGEVVYRPQPATKDVDRIETTFNGAWVAPNGVYSALLQFLLRTEADNVVYARTNILPGKYGYYIKAYGADGGVVGQTKNFEFDMNDKTFVDTFNGTDIVVYTSKRNE